MLLLIWSVTLSASPVTAHAATPLAITNVTVIDATGAGAQADMTVIIVGDRITGIDKANCIIVPKGARVLDGRGKYLIPGLWDMHVHIRDERFLELFTAYGVTGVRHMFTPPLTSTSSIKKLQAEIDAGKRSGPRIIAAFHAIDGAKPVAAGDKISVKNAKDAQDAVRKLKADGEDFIKVYSNLSREAYFAILDEANRGPRKLAVAGHVPHAVSAAEASDRGQKSIEHAYSVLLGCSTKEEQLRKDLLGLVAGGRLDKVDAATAWRIHVQAIQSYDDRKATALFEKFAKNGTWQVPTLTVRRAWSSLHDPTFTNDERKKNLPNGIGLLWTHTVDKGVVKLPLMGVELNMVDIQNQKILFRAYLKLVKSMHDAKVKLLAGTDTPIPYCFPGSGVHDELELLVEAGMTPLEAIQTATRNPAEYLERLKDLGTIEKDKIADLVLLETDPLKDIRNMRKIAAVVVRGTYLSRESLDKLRDGK